MTMDSQMTIQTEDFKVWYEPEANVVHLSGVMRLAGSEAYLPIADLLKQASLSTHVLTIDIRGLKLLNSSGIHMLSKFMIQQRKREMMQIRILGSEKVEWQNKTLETLRRLLPNLTLDLD
jgi:hypothetical protein